MRRVTAVPWRAATQAALYGPGGFFVSGTAVPAAHFRTSVHASPLYAQALLSLARACGLRAVVDVGAGGGELLTGLRANDGSLLLTGVDLAPRPAALDASVGWAATVESLDPLDGLPTGGVLVVANEWLDDVPVDVVEVRDGEPRLVLVEPSTGAESLGPPVGGRDAEWLSRWWPLGRADDGTRAELGWPRDEAWASVVRWATSTGRPVVLVCADYAHVEERRPLAGTVSAYRDGREVAPLPDGSCDITSAVALDAVASAGAAAGAEWSVLTTQRSALRALADPPARPSYDDAQRDPLGTLRALTLAGEWAELVDPSGLGSFGWLVQGAGLGPPAALGVLPPFGA